MRKTVTLATLAKELGLSESAVSKALNGYSDISPETKKLVRSKADELGYSPNLMARNLAKKSFEKKTSNFIGVVLSDSSSIYGEMFKSLNAVARRNGLSVILCDSGNDVAVETACVQNLMDMMAMGIVIVPVSENIDHIRKMTKDRMPAVYLGGRVRDDAVNYVCTDSGEGTELALRHLVKRGHRKIVMLCDQQTSGLKSRKVQAYQALMRSLWQQEQILYCDGTESDMLQVGYKLGKRLLESGTDFTALFAAEDRLAIGAMCALKEAGIKVPEQVSVVGYDGSDAAALQMVGLTTMVQPRMEMAEKIMEMILKQANEPDAAPEHYLAKVQLMIRNSTSVR